MGKKKADNTDLIVGVCLDESGSMHACWDATISGFNEYVQGLAAQKGKTTLTLTLFSSGDPSGNYRVHTDAQPIGKFAALSHNSYSPHGSTPLFDAIGHTINALTAKLVGVKKPNVLFVIQTDGQENDSREYGRRAIFDLIRAKEAEGWKFIYLGANQDEYAAGQAAVAMGMMRGQSVTYDYATTDSAYAGLTQTSGKLRANAGMSSVAVASSVRDTIAEAEDPESAKGKGKGK